MKVGVQCKKLVKPLVPTPRRGEKLKLSFIDDLQTPYSTGIIFYYKHDADTTGHDVSQRLRCMEESLSQTLTLFYPFAGRYVEDGQFIDCDDEGAEFVVANVDGRIDQLLQRQPDVDLLNCLSNFASKVSGHPLLTVQVNVFGCGGLVLAVRFTHKIGDMYTMAMFMKSWTTACRGNNPEVIVPNFALSSIFPSREPLSLHWGAPQIGKEKPVMVMNRFVFNGRTISKMKALIQSKPLAPSRLEVVLALICQALINIDEKKHGKFRPFTIFVTMNLREKVCIPVPRNACGNFFIMVAATTKIKLEFEELVTLIGDALRHAKTRYATVTNGEELCSMAKDSMLDFAKIEDAGDANQIPVSSWCRFPLYENDFGWGKPALVSVAPPHFKSIYLSDTNINGGVDAWITLGEGEMTLFKQDPNILASTSFPICEVP